MATWVSCSVFSGSTERRPGTFAALGLDLERLLKPISASHPGLQSAHNTTKDMIRVKATERDFSEPKARLMT
jgi:hypothetical protein